MKKILLSLVAASALLGFNAQAEKLVVGATPVPHAEILEFVKPALAAQGVELDIRVFLSLIHI